MSKISQMNWITLPLMAAAALLLPLHSQADDHEKKPATEEKPAAPQEEAKASPYKTLSERIAYFVGFQVGSSIPKKDLKIDLNAAAMTKGVQDAIAGKESALGSRAGKSILEEYTAHRLKVANEYMKNLETKDGVIKTDSGLIYEVIKKGTGDTSPTATDKVKVHYSGKLIDGFEFDSSKKRGTPAEFEVNRVIAGWTEALQLMKKGDNWRLYIPPAIGYGERGTTTIGTNEVLIFEVELLDIVK